MDDAEPEAEPQEVEFSLSEEMILVEKDGDLHRKVKDDIHQNVGGGIELIHRDLRLGIER